MSDESFEKLAVWPRSLDVAVKALLRDRRDFGFCQQITGSADSISANIAEGAERNTKLEFRQLLGYAAGSAGETRSRLYIARRLGYVDEADADLLLDERRRVSRMLNGLIRSLES